MGIATVIETEIQQALARIESEHGVRILLAVESGSRAWGFAAPDSDYDVRFIYTHPRDWYLSIGETRDVIEVMLPNDLDLSGWDLRKTLRLFARCNLALNEWLDSPIVYRGTPGFVEDLRALVPTYFRPTAAMFHYLGIARSAYAAGLESEHVKLKKLFYVLRPLLACRWIEHTRSQPPTAFAQLKAAAWVSDAERARIIELETAKARAAEADRHPLDQATRQWLLDAMQYVESMAPTLAVPAKSDPEPLDQLFRRWLSVG